MDSGGEPGVCAVADLARRRVMFLVPRLTPALPGNTPAAPPPRIRGQARRRRLAGRTGTTREIGPFQVRALGNRLGMPRCGRRPRSPNSRKTSSASASSRGEKKKADGLVGHAAGHELPAGGRRKVGTAVRNPSHAVTP